MEPSTDELAHAVDLVSRLGPLGTLPDVTTRTIALVDDPDATCAMLHDVIAGDPAVSVRVLKVANSPLYGLARQVGSLRRAIGLLGLQATRNIVVASSMATLCRRASGTPPFRAHALWVHSGIVATAASALATACGHRPEEAYLAGLLHDIGSVVHMVSQPEAFARMVSLVVGGTPQVEAERAVLGASHAMVGAVMCDRWRLPSSLVDAIRTHHSPQATSENARPYAQLVHAANALAGTLPDAELAPDTAGGSYEDAVRPLGLDSGAAAEVRADVARGVADLVL